MVQFLNNTMLAKFQVFKHPVLQILVLVLLARTVEMIVSLLAPYALPYQGFFSYGPTMLQYGMPDFIRALTNFDGIFYIRIATLGYQFTEQAYFPLYPMLIRIVMMVVGNPITAGVFVSYTTFFAGIVLFEKYLSHLTRKKNIRWIIFFLLAYPTSYYFGVVYTESLFFFLVVGTLYFLKQKQYVISMLLAYCASLTRVVGILLIIPIVAIFLQEVMLFQKKSAATYIVALVSQWRIALAGVASLLGLATYMLYLGKTLGDPLYFLHAQESFGAHRSSTLITPLQVVYRYLNIFFSADHTFQYFVAVLELLFYGLVLGLVAVELRSLYKLYKRKKLLQLERLGLAMFSLACVLVPSLTGTLTAMPRYTLMSLTLFLVLGELKNTTIKVVLLALFCTLHICFFALFVQGYYVT